MDEKRDEIKKDEAIVEKTEEINEIKQEPLEPLKETDKDKKGEDLKKLDKSVRNLIIIFVIIAVLGILILVFRTDLTNLIQEQLGTRFKYNDMTFEKINYGTIPMYQTTVYFVFGKLPVQHNLLLRTDPRLLDSIYIDFNNPGLLRKSYISLTPDSEKCNDTVIAAVKIGEIFGALTINNSAAVTDVNMLKNDSFAKDPERVKTCDDSANATVVILKQSDDNRTYISHVYDGYIYPNCYVLYYENCDKIVPVSERFILLVIEILRKNLE